jgi:hypothetical protein
MAKGTVFGDYFRIADNRLGTGEAPRTQRSRVAMVASAPPSIRRFVTKRFVHATAPDVSSVAIV